MIIDAVGVVNEVVKAASCDLIADVELALIQLIFGLSATIASMAEITAVERAVQFVALVAHLEFAVRLQFIESDLSSKMRMSG